MHGNTGSVGSVFALLAYKAPDRETQDRNSTNFLYGFDFDYRFVKDFLLPRSLFLNDSPPVPSINARGNFLSNRIRSKRVEWCLAKNRREILQSQMPDGRLDLSQDPKTKLMDAR